MRLFSSREQTKTPDYAIYAQVDFTEIYVYKQRIAVNLGLIHL